MILPGDIGGMSGGCICIDGDVAVVSPAFGGITIGGEDGRQINEYDVGDVEEAGMTPNGSGGCKVGTAALEDAPCSPPAST